MCIRERNQHRSILEKVFLHIEWIYCHLTSANNNGITTRSGMTAVYAVFAVE